MIGVTMTSANKAILAIVVAIVVIVGAFGVYVATKPSATGKVSIMVKDLPDDWTHVNVTFSEVQIHQADVNSGWHNLTIASQTIDLAVLLNVSELLASANVGPGNYTQIRLVVDSVTGTMANGTVVNFTVPSGELKTTHPFNVTAGQTTTLTLDFDLEKSIVVNAQGYKFKPVLGSIVVS
jgi:capsular polysaccharide biosynthesis protein